MVCMRQLCRELWLLHELIHAAISLVVSMSMTRVHYMALTCFDAFLFLLCFLHLRLYT